MLKVGALFLKKTMSRNKFLSIRTIFNLMTCKLDQEDVKKSLPYKKAVWKRDG